jgi:hypothetical protein
VVPALPREKVRTYLNKKEEKGSKKEKEKKNRNLQQKWLVPQLKWQSLLASTEP